MNMTIINNKNNGITKDDAGVDHLQLENLCLNLLHS